MKISRIFSALLITILIVAAMPASQTSANGCLPASVSTEAGLVAAINCYNAETVPATYVITLTANISLTASTPAIDNTTSGIDLVIEGGNLTVSGQGISGVRPFQIAPSTIVTMKNITITGGNVSAAGGILTQTGSNLTLDNAKVIGNTSSGRAGGVYNYYATVIIKNGSVIGRSGSPNTSGGQGGGIFAEGPDSVTTIDNSTVSYNVETQWGGGGIFILNGELIIRNGSLIDNNTGGDQDLLSYGGGGGGIYVNSSDSVTITDSTISNNMADCKKTTPCGGGGLWSAGQVNITNSTIKENIVKNNVSGNSNGGGIYIRTGTTTITNSTLSQNSSLNGNGGGIYTNDGTTTIMTSTVSANTTATGDGAGLYLSAGILNIDRSTINNNQANGFGDGGGLHSNNGSYNITNATFSANRANGGYGGAIEHSNGAGIINNSTFAENYAGDGSDGIRKLNGTVSFSNTIIVDHQFENCGGNAVSDGGHNLSDDSDCGFSGDNGITSGVDIATILADNGGLTKTYALMTGSNAIGTGNNATCENTDQRGVGRPQSTTCDIGAFEVDSTAPTVTTTNISSSYTTRPTSLTFTFSEDVFDAPGESGLTDDVTDLSNYMLVEEGSTAGFQTTACNNIDLVNDSISVADSLSYNNATFRTTLNFNTPIPEGTYRLFVCGTTSIVDWANTPLNGGTDSVYDFTVQTESSASSLPDTGFRHGEITQLHKQPAAQAYTSTAMLLEIPKLSVSMPIVGVPLTNGEWDVTWLGNSAGYLAGSAFPTWAGNTVITGHVWDAYNQPGIFSELKTLKYGDQIHIQAWSLTYTYEVRESKLVTKKNVNAAFQSEEYDWLTLVTCEFYNPFSGEYLFRRAVRAVLVSVK